MSKRTKVLQFLFLLTIITKIIASDAPILGETRNLNENTDNKIDNTDNKIDNTDNKIDNTNNTIKTDKLETKEEKSKRLCGETQPLKGIKEECYQEEIKNSNNEVCCYMTIKYETSEHFECIPVNKNLAEIKNKIKEIKQNYEGSKSINIDCNSSLIRITLISFLLFLLF